MPCNPLFIGYAGAFVRLWQVCSVSLSYRYHSDLGGDKSSGMLVFVRSCATQNHLTFLQIMSCDKLARKYTTFLVDIQIKMPFLRWKTAFWVATLGICVATCYGVGSVRVALSYGYHTVIYRLSYGNGRWTVAELLLIFVSKETVFWGMDGRIRNKGDWKEMEMWMRR